MGKTTTGYRREHGLTIEQLNAIDLLVTGKTDKEVADKVGVNRVTVTKWKNYDIHFQAELNKRRKEIWGTSADKLRYLVPKAIERLEKEIENEGGWKTALEIIKLAQIDGRDIKYIGHDSADKILNELAQQRMTEELFNNSNDYAKQKLLEEYQNLLK